MQRFPNVRKGKWLKGLSVIDEHDQKPFRECDELDAKQYAEEKVCFFFYQLLDF